MKVDRRTFLKLFLLGVVGLYATKGGARGDNQPTIMKKQNYQVAAYFWPNWHRHETYRPPGWRERAAVDTADDFGEWDILKAAKPRFAGHAQPKVPAWGYEDESDPKVMAKKIDAAADHGVDAFIFDWYFVNNGPYLSRTLNDGFLKAKNNHRVKFGLMWAADNSLRAGDKLTPRARFDLLVSHVIENYMSHPSYWKIDGKPYFSIYDVGKFVEAIGNIEEARRALDHLRDAAKARGLAGVHLNLVDLALKNRDDAATLATALGADSVTSYVWVHAVALKDFPQTDYERARNDYFQYCGQATTAYGVPYLPHVTMGWDSTPRIAPGAPFNNCGYPDMPILKNNTPANFKRALLQAKAFLDQRRTGPRVLTINAWNEWTEGSYLEPDAVHGLAYLKAIKEVFR